MIFPEGVLYDYSAFGTTKTADIYTLKQLIDTPNSTMVPREGIEPPTPASSGLRSTTELPRLSPLTVTYEKQANQYFKYKLPSIRYNLSIINDNNAQGLHENHSSYPDAQWRR